MIASSATFMQFAVTGFLEDIAGAEMVFQATSRA